MNYKQKNSRELKESQKALAADLRRVAVEDRWGLALLLTGWLHLAVFLVCQWLTSIGVHGPDATGFRDSVPYLTAWTVELLGVFLIFRRVAGRGWADRTPLGIVVLRIWVTFLILAFNVVSLNSLSGWSVVWFRPVWATLSSFGFAAMAWLVRPGFLLAAVLMYVSGLLMALNGNMGYLIYGVSWWAVLQAIGLVMERQRSLDRSLSPKRLRLHAEPVPTRAPGKRL